MSFISVFCGKYKLFGNFGNEVKGLVGGFRNNSQKDATDGDGIYHNQNLDALEDFTTGTRMHNQKMGGCMEVFYHGDTDE